MRSYELVEEREFTSGWDGGQGRLVVGGALGLGLGRGSGLGGGGARTCCPGA